MIQPALFVADMAAVERLKAEHPEVYAKVSACVGFSVGEYAALCAAGVLPFEDALRIVQLRSQTVMNTAVLDNKGSPQGMCSILGIEPEKLQSLCDTAQEKF